MAEADALLCWLASADLDTPSGHCLSWWNPDRPGYPYPEISGLLLRLLSLAGAARPRRDRLHHALITDYRADRAVRRGAQSYIFDTAMVLSGVLAHAAAGGPAGRPAVGTIPAGRAAVRPACDWAGLLIEAAGQANPVAGGRHPGRLTADTHWSMAFGAHQAKVCGALLDADRHLGPLAGLTEAVDACSAAALDVQEDDGRFRIHAASPMTYTHAHCYAVEGLLMRAAAGHGSAGEAILAGASWLAAAQQPDGSLRAWHDGRTASGPPRADATAQALRIWILVDPGRFAGPAARAREFLTRLRAAPRGLRYQPGSGDLNSWATIFAVQALSWHDDPAAADAARVV